MTLGNSSPCPTKVMRMTPKVIARMRSRYGNGAPVAVASGMASAAASETTPRMPTNAITKADRQGGDGSRRAQPPRHVGGRKHPEEPCSDHNHRGEQDSKHEIAQPECVRPLERRPSLQASQQEDEA